MENWEELINRIRALEAVGKGERISFYQRQQEIERQRQEERDKYLIEISIMMQNTLDNLGIPQLLDSFRKGVWKSGQLETFSRITKTHGSPHVRTQFGMSRGSDTTTMIRSGYRLVHKYPTTLDLGTYVKWADDNSYGVSWRPNVQQTEGFTDILIYLDQTHISRPGFQPTSAALSIGSRVYLGRGKSKSAINTDTTEDIFLNAGNPESNRYSELSTSSYRVKTPVGGSQIGLFSFDGTVFSPRDSVSYLEEQIKVFLAKDAISRREHNLMPEGFIQPEAFT